MTPDFTLVVDGENRTGEIASRLISLTLKDESGFASDSLALVLDDADGVIAMPRKGAKIQVALGYKESGVRAMGVYTVDDVAVSGPPAQMKIRAKAADMREGLKQQKSRSWDSLTLGGIAATIAAENGLQSVVSSEFSALPIDHVDQSDESDINLLTRLAKARGAQFKVAADRLIISLPAQGVAVSGVKMPSIRLTLGQVSKWSASFPDRGRFASVVASWGDVASGKLSDVSVGQGQPVHRLRDSYPSESEARQAATAAYKRLNRSEAKLSLSVPGDASMQAESPLRVSGFRRGVDGDWVAQSVTHTINARGYVCSLSATPKS